MSSREFPAGVALVELRTRADHRGAFTEVFREEWDVGLRPLQWNVVASQRGVLRGFHVHVRHWDYLIVVAGRATIGLRDLRRRAPTFALATTVELSGATLRALLIPPGVGHGFYFHESSLHVYSVSAYWDLADELGCHWADPALEIAWPCAEAELSPRDASARSFAALMAELEPRQKHYAAASNLARSPI